MKTRIVMLAVEVADEVTDEQIIEALYGQEGAPELDFTDISFIDPTD